MGTATFIKHTALSIDIGLLDECARIWKMSGFKGLPPSPYEVLAMDSARRQVITYVNIAQWAHDESKRNG
jgi:hypothetical protein